MIKYTNDAYNKAFTNMKANVDASYDIHYNRHNATEASPYFTVITPVYNRRSTIERTLRSVARQTFTDWEYIIIDDGSSEDSDDIIFHFMESQEHPILYIKKSNGGVHTARNLGIKNAKGILTIFLDSDDELTDNALETFCSAWQGIPDEKKILYREIVAHCMDSLGNRIGNPFPSNINSLSREDEKKTIYRIKGEHIGCQVSSVLKENLFPEARGITFVTEDLLWRKLDRVYRSYYINDILRVYHNTKDIERLTKHQKTPQFYLNRLFSTSYVLNRWKTYRSGKSYIKTMLIYVIMRRLLSKDKEKSKYLKRYRIKGVKNHLFYFLIFIPGMAGAKLYARRK